MTKRQIGQHRRFDLCAQPIDHALQLEAFVVRREFVAAELAQHNRFLLRQNACMQKLRKHALKAVRVFADIF